MAHPAPAHLGRNAYIYVRQSTLAQTVRNTESLLRQYDLAGRARQLGWAEHQIVVIDDDLGRSGASAQGRKGFSDLVADVGLGKAGIVLSLESSRLARNKRRLVPATRCATRRCVFVRRWKGSAAGPSQRPGEAGGSLSAPRGAVVYGWRWKTSISSPPQRCCEAGGSLSRGSPVRTGVATRGRTW